MTMGKTVPDSVSCETSQRIATFKSLLQKWNTRINLVSDADPDLVQKRHVEDSIQLLEHVPEGAKTWADLGSGAGFPGLICACCLPDRSPLNVTLVESDQRKAAFLREAIRATGAPATVQNHRIENLTAQPYDIISARALAPLHNLLAYAERLSHEDTVLLFLKGRRLESELTEALTHWSMESEKIPSRTDSEGTILKIHRFSRRT